MAHGAVTLALLVGARTPRGAGGSLGGGAPEKGNIAQCELAIRVIGALAHLLLLGKAVAVAILAPEDVTPPPEPHGAVGLACMYVSICTGLVGTAVAGLLARHQLLAWEHAALSHAKLAPSGDEESALTAPLLGGKGTAASGSSSGSGGAAKGAENGEGAAEGAGGRKAKGTVGQLLKMSLPDTPVLLAAFAAGAVAALMAGMVPYYTGRESTSLQWLLFLASRVRSTVIENECAYFGAGNDVTATSKCLIAVTGPYRQMGSRQPAVVGSRFLLHLLLER